MPKKISYPKKNKSKNIYKKKRNYNQMISQYTEKKISELKILSNKIKKKFKTINEKEKAEYNKMKKISPKKENKHFDIEVFKNNPYISANNIDYNILFTKLMKSYSINLKNNCLYSKIINHSIINENEIEVTETTRNGNCFYNELSKFFFGDEKYYDLIRQTLYQYTLKKESDIINNNPYIDHLGKLYPTKNYIKLTQKNYFYAGTLNYPKLYFVLI